MGRLGLSVSAGNPSRPHRPGSCLSASLVLRPLRRLLVAAAAGACLQPFALRWAEVWAAPCRQERQVVIQSESTDGKRLAQIIKARPLDSNPQRLPFQFSSSSPSRVERTSQRKLYLNLLIRLYFDLLPSHLPSLVCRTFTFPLSLIHLLPTPLPRHFGPRSEPGNE